MKDKNICYSKDNTLFLKKQIWETDFFQRKMGLVLVNQSELSKLDHQKLEDIFNDLVSYADGNDFKILELKCDIKEKKLVAIVEQIGFRLVEVRVDFVTLMHKQMFPATSSDMGELCYADKENYDDLIKLTHASFTDNPEFLSRFKDNNYFSSAESKKYYTAYIDNHLQDDQTQFGVLKKEGKVIGYSILKPNGRLNEKAKYKAMLSAVDPNFRGLGIYNMLQTFVCNQLPENEFYLENTTQLTNVSIINSHIKTQKQFDNVSLIFYRKFDKLKN